MKKIFIITICSLVPILLFTNNAMAVADKLPEVLVGQTEIITGNPQQTYYGGFTGNEVVYNHTNDATNPSGATGQTGARKLAPSMNFDGADDYIMTNPIIFSGDTSISAWFRPETYPTSPALTWGGFGFFQYIDNTNGTGWGIIPTADGIKVDVGRTGLNHTSKTFGTSIPTGNWSHILVTHSSGVFTVYLNGEQVGSPWPQSVVYNATGDKVQIGKWAWNHDLYRFDGQIDDTRIYTRALSDTEASNLYKGEAITNGLKGYWDFSEGTGDIAKDKSGNGNDGTLYNFAKTSDSGWYLESNYPAEVSNSGNELFGFDQNSLTNITSGCINDIIFHAPMNRCFFSNSRNGNVKVMSSRTSVNQSPSTPVLELAALYYPPKGMIVGDAYLGNMDPNNFSYWGRNLVQNSGTNATSTDSFWGMNNYTNNPNAQANMSGSEYETYIKKIVNLGTEAQVIGPADLYGNTSWYLQGSTGLTENGNLDAPKYPNGKVWSVNTGSTGTIDLTANTTYTYYGKGTLIIRNPSNNAFDLRFLDGTKLIAGTPDSRLGIMVVDGNDTIFSGNNQVQATMLCYSPLDDPAEGGNFNFNGDNIDLIGSFVAEDFINLTGANARSNIRFYYDKGLDSSWPPGFRDLNMPHPTEN